MMTATDPQTNLPFLHPAGWPGHEACLCRRLTDNPRAPWVSYGVDRPTAVLHLTRETARDEGISLRDIDRAARRALMKRPARARWEVERMPFGNGHVTLLLREGDQFTASDILDPRLLRAAHARLARDEPELELFYIGIPSRHHVVAGADPLSMLGLVADLYGNAVADPQTPEISPLAFMVADGKIVGVASHDTDDEPGDAGEDVVPWFRPTPMLIDEGDGRGAMLMAMTCEGFDELARAIQHEFRCRADGLSAIDGFGGRVLFEVNPDGVRPSRENRARLADLGRFLTEQAGEMRLRAPDGSAIEVVCRFGESMGEMRDAPRRGGRRRRRSRTWRAAARPGGVIAAAVMDFIVAGFCAIGALVMLAASQAPEVQATGAAGFAVGVAFVVGLIGLGFGGLGIALLTRKSWARTAQIVVSGLAAGLAVLALIANPSITRMFSVVLYALPAILVIGDGARRYFADTPARRRRGRR